MYQKLSKQKMCKLTSNSISHESNEDNPNTSTMNVEENSNMLTPLISKPQTSQQEIQNPNNINFSIYLNETKCIANIALPMILSGLLLYARSMISMIFLGHLGELALAGGSLAIGFANITGYSILSGLAIGMEPICGQAFGANRFNLLGLVMQRMVLLLLLTSVFISFLWINMKKILIFFGQEKEIASEAQFYLIYCIPDLIIQSLLHPLRIYLRSQSITLPLTYCAALSIILHLPINYLLVIILKLGTKGVALAVVCTHFNLVASLIMYTIISGVHNKTWDGISYACFRANPNASVASMGVLIQTTSLIYIFPHSLSFGVSTRVGNELGAENPERAKLAARIGVCFSFVLGVLAFGFTFSVRNVWSTMFTNDAQIITLTSMVLPIVGACELGNCPQTTVCGVLRGTARPKFGANINLGCFYLVGMPIAVWLSFFAGFDFKGLWLGLLAAQFSCMITMLFVLARTNWEGQAQRAKELTSCDANEELKIEDEECLLGSCATKQGSHLLD
ncbi:unnamed protein product [Lupinus luteus]|uniref:Protein DETOXIFICATION n=1 Tax=Lupinus luteus TaxID=3873 RepID=A0AAV1YAB3_LUPLU